MLLKQTMNRQLVEVSRDSIGVLDGRDDTVAGAGGVCRRACVWRLQATCRQSSRCSPSFCGAALAVVSRIVYRAGRVPGKGSLRSSRAFEGPSARVKRSKATHVNRTFTEKAGRRNLAGGQTREPPKCYSNHGCCLQFSIRLFASQNAKVVRGKVDDASAVRVSQTSAFLPEPGATKRPRTEWAQQVQNGR